MPPQRMQPTVVRRLATGGEGLSSPASLIDATAEEDDVDILALGLPEHEQLVPVGTVDEKGANIFTFGFLKESEARPHFLTLRKVKVPK